MASSRYKIYPEYKDTHLGWLSEIPSHWEVKRLKYLGEALIGLTYSPDDVVDAENENAVLVLRSSNVQNKQLAFDDNVYVNKTIPDHLITKKGDILICARNGSRALIGKNAQIDEATAGSSFGAFMSVYRSPFNDYLSKVFNSALFEYQSGSFLTATINQLTTGNLNGFEIPLPSEGERKTIANFLDHETSKIDTLIEEQQSLIRLLQEKRQAVISHAVTKGLNPDAPMKDSGVEWLGEVPEHWDVKRIKNFGRVIGGFAFKSGDFSDSGYPVIKIANVGHFKLEWNDASFLPVSFAATQSEYKAPKNSLIFAMTRPVISGGIKVAKINNDSKPLVNQRVGFLSTEDDSITEFILQSTQSSPFLAQFVNNMTVTNQPNISSEGIEAVYFPVPPTEEVQPILFELQKIESLYTNLLDEGQIQIELLKERRTALISAAVTGKIDVRDWTAPIQKQQAQTAVEVH